MPAVSCGGTGFLETCMSIHKCSIHLTPNTTHNESTERHTDTLASLQTEAQAENSFCLTHPPSTLPLNAWKGPKRATEEGASASAFLRLAKVTLTLPP